MLFFTLAAAWSCTAPNPEFRVQQNNDAPQVGDVKGPPDEPPDATPDPVPDARADDVRSVVDAPPAADVSPMAADAPGDAAAARDAAPGADANPGDTPVDSGADVAPGTDGGVLPPPEVTMGKLTYDAGETISVSFSGGPGNASDFIGIYHDDAPPPSDLNRSRLWWYTDNTGWAPRPPGIGPRNGTVTFGPGSMGSGPWPLASRGYKAFFCTDSWGVVAGPVYFQVR